MLTLAPTIKEDLPHLWRILKESPDFFADAGAIETEEEFADWFDLNAQDSLTGLDDGVVIGCGYLDAVYPGYYGSVNIFKIPGRKSLRELVEALRGVLSYWFVKYEFEKLVGIIRSDNRACRLFAKALGFQVDGVLRHHRKVNGIWTDYLMTSILRSEL